MNWLLKRLSEKSTYLGLASVIAGVGALGKINEAPMIADMVSTQGAVVGSLIASSLSVFASEKGNE